MPTIFYSKFGRRQRDENGPSVFSPLRRGFDFDLLGSRFRSLRQRHGEDAIGERRLDLFTIHIGG